MYSFEYSIQVVYRFVIILWRGWWYIIDFLYRRYVSSFACGGDQSPLFIMVLVGNSIESGPCLEVGGFPSPLSDILIKGGCICQKGDPFENHHHVINSLPSCMHKVSLLLQFLYQTG